MAATTPATDLVSALFVINGNVHSLYEASVDLKSRLTLWRNSFFPLLDKDDVEQNKVHHWIVPTIALEQELSSVQTWFQIEEIIVLMNSSLAAARWNGYVPTGTQLTTMVAAFNAAWT